MEPGQHNEFGTYSDRYPRFVVVDDDHMMDSLNWLINSQGSMTRGLRGSKLPVLRSRGGGKRK